MAPHSFLKRSQRQVKAATQRVLELVATPKDEIEFQSNGVLTLGAEIELQLVDPADAKLTAKAAELLAAGARITKLKPEIFTTMAEINTAKCTSAREIETDLAESIREVSAVAHGLGLQLATTGVHPFTRYMEQTLAPSERYAQLIDRNQWLARRIGVFGLHVHIGMESGDACIRFNNFFMNFLPHFIALSASSPFWQGEDTGLASCRPTVFEALPTAGLPYLVKNWREFEHLYDSLKGCGSITSLKDLWWDMRPSPGYGTLEIRVCDGPATLYEASAIVAYIHLLAHWFHENGSWMEAVSYPPRWKSRENKWRAIRHGLEAELVTLEGKPRPLRDDLRDWMEQLRPLAIKLGYEMYLERLEQIITRGNSSQRQRAVFQRTQSLEAVVAHNVAEFEAQRPLWD